MSRRATKDQSGFLPIIELVAVVAAIIVVVGAYFVYRHAHQASKASVSSQSSASKPSAPLSSTTTNSSSTSSGSSSNSSSSSTRNSSKAIPLTLQGMVTSDNCYSGGPACGDVGRLIVVNGVSLTLSQGNIYSTQPWGSVSNAPSGTYVGHHVEVYARVVNSTNQTLAGNASYFCKFTD